MINSSEWHFFSCIPFKCSPKAPTVEEAVNKQRDRINCSVDISQPPSLISLTTPCLLTGFINKMYKVQGSVLNGGFGT